MFCVVGYFNMLLDNILIGMDESGWYDRRSIDGFFK